MSPTTETCACGASITVDVRDGLVLGFRLAEWRKEHQHDDEVKRLRGWKAEALTVLAGWEDVYEALGRPGPLGASKAFAALVEVKSLREREARVRALCDESRVAISAGFVVTDEFRANVERDFAGLMREHLGPGYVDDFYVNEAGPFAAACLYFVDLALRGEA